MCSAAYNQPDLRYARQSASRIKSQQHVIAPRQISNVVAFRQRPSNVSCCFYPPEFNHASTSRPSGIRDKLGSLALSLRSYHSGLPFLYSKPIPTFHITKSVIAAYTTTKRPAAQGDTSHPSCKWLWIKNTHQIHRRTTDSDAPVSNRSSKIQLPLCQNNHLS